MAFYKCTEKLLDVIISYNMLILKKIFIINTMSKQNNMKTMAVLYFLRHE